MVFGQENLTDIEIFKKVEKNPEIFSVIIDRYEKKIEKYIKRNSNFDPNEVEDIMQDIFISVYQNANSFRFDMKFSSWIYRIAHNKIIDHWRKNKKGKESISLDENVSFVETFFNKDDVCEEIEKIEKKEIVEKVMPFVKEKYRQVLVLRFLEEKTYEEISEILRKPKGSVGTLVARGQKDFAKQMQKIINKK